MKTEEIWIRRRLRQLLNQLIEKSNGPEAEEIRRLREIFPEITEKEIKSQ